MSGTRAGRGFHRIAALAFALTAVVVAVGAASALASYPVARTWGTPGEGEGQLSAPLSVSLDGRGSLYVAADTRVLQFSNTGRFIKQYSEVVDSSGADLGPVGNVLSLVADEDGDIWVANDHQRVMAFAPSGRLITFLGSLRPGGAIIRLASDHRGTIYINRVFLPGDALAGEAYIDMYSRGTGSWLGTWGPNLRFPTSVAFGPGGRQYVIDDGEISIFTHRAFTETWVDGYAGKSLNAPTALAVDTRGYLYITDRLNNRVLKLTSQGHVVAVLTAKPSPLTQLPFSPGPLDVARTGQVFVGDTNGQRIVEFKAVGPQTTIELHAVVGSDAQFDYYATSSTGDKSEAITFECRFDHHAWKDCSTPGPLTSDHQAYTREYRGLRPGKHHFAVRAIGADGNPDATPAQRSFLIHKPAHVPQHHH